MLFNITELPTPLIKDSTKSTSADSPNFMTVWVWGSDTLRENSMGPMVGVGMTVGCGVAVGMGVGAAVAVGIGVGVGVAAGIGVRVGAEVSVAVGTGVAVGAATGMIMNGPRCTVLVQLPALSAVLRWNHHDPKDNRGLVVWVT